MTFHVVGDLATNWPLVDVRAYGATGNGVTDDTAAFNAALAYLHTRGGGTLLMPPGIYKISSTLTITDPISIQGHGTSGADTFVANESLVTKGVSVISWAGGATPVLAVAGPVRGIHFERFAIEGNSAATIGISLDRVQRSTFRNLRVAHCITNGMLLTTTGTTGAGDNTMFNLFLHVSLERHPVPLKLDSANINCNVCHNTFVGLFTDQTSDPGIYLGWSDNNAFYSAYTFAHGGVGEAVWAQGTAGGQPQVSLSNIFYHLQGIIRVRPGASAVVYHYDRSNGQAEPVIEAGGHLMVFEAGAVGSGRLRSAIEGDFVVTAGTVTLPHLASNTGTPSPVIQAGAGGGAASTSIAGTDVSGVLTVTTGTTPTTAALLVVVNFATAYDTAAKAVLISEANQATASLAVGARPYVGSWNTGGWWINTSGTALAAGTTYQWRYVVI